MVVRTARLSESIAESMRESIDDCGSELDW